MTVEQSSRVAEPPSDALVQRIAAGDRSAEAELVRRYQRGVVVLARRHCRAGDPVAEDLAQDVLARVLERLRVGALRDVASLTSYIQTAVIHAATAEYRRRHPTAESDLATIHDEQGSPAEQLGQRQLQTAVNDLLHDLPVERDRELLLRFYVREQSKSEVCSALGIDAAHFHRVVFRARERFRAVLERAGIEGS